MNQAYFEQGIQPLPTERSDAFRSSLSAFEKLAPRSEPVFEPGEMSTYETQMVEFSENYVLPARRFSIRLTSGLMVKAQGIAQQENSTTRELFRKVLCFYPAPGETITRKSVVSADQTKARRVGGQNLLGVTYIATDFDDPMTDEELKEWGY